MDNKDLTLVDRFNLESHNAEKVYENAFNDLKDRRAKDLKNLDKKGENICRYYQFKATDFADVICDL